jgi:hypothetical protein
MTGYALGLLVAWGYDSGWAAVRRLVPALIRALAAAGVAAVVGLPLVNAFIGQESLTVWSGLGVVLIGGLTTLATFLGVSALMRSPELRDVLSH